MTAPAIATSPRRLDCPPQVRRIIRLLRAHPRPIVLGASGGIDSGAAMLLLAAAGVPTLAVHVHHHLRQDADNDQDVTQSQARTLGLPFCVVHLPTKRPDTHENLSQRSRILRYDRLTDIARRHGADVITAHHADDLLETFLMRATRGASLEHAFGPQKTIQWHDVTVFRPLLSLSKHDLRNLITQTNFPWIEDSSNRSDKYARNRLRRAMSPLVAQLSKTPHFHETLARMAEEATAVGAQRAKDHDLQTCVARTWPAFVSTSNPSDPSSPALSWIDRMTVMQRYDHDLTRCQHALYRWCTAHDIMPRNDVLHDIVQALWEARPVVRELRGCTLRVFRTGLCLERGTVRDTLRVSESTDITAQRAVKLVHDTWITVGIYALRLRNHTGQHPVMARVLAPGDRFPSPHSGRMVGVRKRLTRDGVPMDQRNTAVVVGQCKPDHRDVPPDDVDNSHETTLTTQHSDTKDDTSLSSAPSSSCASPLPLQILGVVFRPDHTIVLYTPQGDRFTLDVRPAQTATNSAPSSEVRLHQDKMRLD